MEPKFPASRLIAVSHAPSYASQRQEEAAAQPEKGAFLSTGWGPDELLNWACGQGVVDEKGRVVENLQFEVNRLLHGPLQAVMAKLRMNGLVYSNQRDFKPHAIAFLDCIRGLQEELHAATAPEIIGGAVPYLLGEQFFIEFAMKRFHLEEEKAKLFLEPALRLIRKRPADIDFRQYVTDMALMNDGFKDLFAEKLTAVLSKKTGNHFLDPQIIKNHYFQKLFFVQDETKLFGMARFGNFNELPLEYFVVKKVDRPYIAYNKSIALTLEKPRRRGEQWRVHLKFYTQGEEGFLQETPLFQQMALVLDAQDVKGVDWRGFLSMMAEMTRAGYRTLTADFLDNLWESFGSAQVDLKEKVQWAVDNHLVNRGESPQEAQELKAAFYLNLCIYLIERNQIDEETVQFFLRSCSRLPDPLNFFKAILLIPNMSLQDKLAWIKVGMWLRLSQSIPEGSLSTNYGQPCHRIVAPGSGAVVWVPVDLEKAARRATSSLRDEDWDKLLIQMEMFTLVEGVKGAYRLSQFTDWMNAADTKEIAARLRVRNTSSHALKVALQIDQARIDSGLERELPAEWLKVLPQLFSFFPEEYDNNAHFHALMAGKGEMILLPKRDTVLAPADWMLHLIQSSHSAHAAIGVEMLKESGSPDEALIEKMEAFTWDIIRKECAIAEEIDFFPWFLFAVCCGAYANSCTLQTSKGGQRFLHIADRRLPIFRSNLIHAGLQFYRMEEAKETCRRLFGVNVLVSKQPVFTSGEKNALKDFARENFDDEIGLQLFLVHLRAEKSIPMALELLPLYPGLHERSPAAGRVILEILESKQSKGSDPLRGCLTKSGAINPIHWVAALLSHARKECVEQGEERAKTLDGDQQQLLWKDISVRLLKSRPEAIPPLIASLSKLAIQPQSHKDFFIQWIDAVKATGKEPKMIELQDYLKQKHPELLNYPVMKKYRGKVIGWLTTLRQVIRKLDAAPQLTWIEQVQQRYQMIEKKNAELKEDGQFADHFLSLDLLPHARDEAEQILRSRLKGLQVDPPRKISLYVKFRFADGASWGALISELDHQQLWNDQLVRNPLGEALSKENGYGRFLWHSQGLVFVELLRRAATIGILMPFEVLPPILSKIFPSKQSENFYHPDASYDALCLLLQLRVIDSQRQPMALEERLRNVDQFISQCESWSLDDLFQNRNELDYYFWQVNRYFWNERGERLCQAIERKDDTTEKRKALAILTCYACSAGVEVDLSAFLSVIERYKDIPEFDDVLVNFSQIVLHKKIGRVVGDQSTLPSRMATLFLHFHYDRFTLPQNKAEMESTYKRNYGKFRLYSSLLDQPIPDASLECIMMQALPIRGWMEFLGLFIRPFFNQKSLARFYLNGAKDHPVQGESDQQLFMRYASVVCTKFKEQINPELIKAFLALYDPSPMAQSLASIMSKEAIVWQAVLHTLRQSGKTEDTGAVIAPQDAEKAIESYQALTTEAQRQEARGLLIRFLNSWETIRVVPQELQETVYLKYAQILVKLKNKLEKEASCAAVMERYREILPDFLETAMDIWIVNGTSYGFDLFLLIRDVTDKEVIRAACYKALIDHSLLEGDLPYLEKMLQEQMEKAKDWVKLQAALEQALKKGRVKELLKGNFSGTLESLWPQLVQELIQEPDSQPDLVEKCLNVVCEQKAVHLLKLKRLFEVYYASSIGQSKRKPADLMTRSAVLLSLIDTLCFYEDDAAFAYFQDVRDIFSTILARGESAYPAEVLKRIFEAFVAQLTISMRNLALPRRLLRELIDQFPGETILGPRLMQKYHVGLFLGLPYQSFKPAMLCNTFKSLFRSLAPLDIHLGLHLMGRLVNELNSKKQFAEINQLLEGVFCAEDGPRQLRFQTWMIGEGMYEWMSSCSAVMKKIRHPQVQSLIAETFKQFVAHYDQIENEPPSCQPRLYLSWAEAVAGVKRPFTLQCPPFDLSIPYESIIRKILDKIVLEYFPQRNTLVESPHFGFPSFAKIVMAYSQSMISAIPCGFYSTEKAKDEKYAETNRLRLEFFGQLCDAALQENDRPFMVEMMNAWKELGNLPDDVSFDTSQHHEVKRLLQDRFNRWDQNSKWAIFKQIAAVELKEESERLSFARDVAERLKEAFAGVKGAPPADEMNKVFVQFVQFITQRFQDKRAAAAILKDLVESHPQPACLKLAPKSLNTVNLSIGTPYKEFIRSPEECVKVAGTLYRYLHSADPLVVDTGFYWFGSLLEQLGQEKEAGWILSLVFNPAYQQEKAPLTKFEGSNPGDLMLEPWMLAEGLSHFLSNMRQKVAGTVQEETKKILKRCFDLFKDIETLPVEQQVRAYYAFFSFLILYRKRRMTAFQGVISDYQFLARKAHALIFSLFLPNLHLLPEGDGNATSRIIEMGTEMIANIAEGSSAHSLFLTELPMISFVEQMQFQNNLVKYGEDHKDLNFLETYLQALKRMKETLHSNIQYDAFITKIKEAIRAMS